MILGTAGHVDHGKTALVKALTGVDTDRLAEEKRRGITIELGFAPLRLADDLLLGVVDVPGHEAFVRTMLAGASGVDLAMLVVAADEGVMPQTREHLEILRLLGTRAGVVALTKVDLVDTEWLALVEDEVRAALANTPLEQATVVRTSVTTGEGLASLRMALIDAARAVPERLSGDLFRLPVDRAFSVRGTGTVVTGTVWSGTVSRDSQVILLPEGSRARVRGIEIHGEPVQAGGAGARVAIALAGVHVPKAPRGTVLVSDPAWRASRVMMAEVELLESAREPVNPRRRLRLHVGTADVEARLVAAGGAVAPGEVRQVRLVLGSPVVARAGDRFVLRSGSPPTTVGGGTINDPLPGRPRPRPWSRGVASSAERLRILLELEGAAGVEAHELAIRTGARPDDVERIIRGMGAECVRVADRLHSGGHLQSLRSQVLALVDEFHAAEPLEVGVPLQLLRSRLGAAEPLSDLVIGPLVADNRLCVDGALAFRAGWTARPSEEQRQLINALTETLEREGREPPGVVELSELHGPTVRPLLRYLEREGTLIQVEPDRYYHRTRLERMVSELRLALGSGEPVGPGALREALGLSRKFLIPFLEYCDRLGITERRGEGRVLRKLPIHQLDT